MANSSSPAPLGISQGTIGVTIYPAGHRIWLLGPSANPWLSACNALALRRHGLKHKNIAAELLDQVLKDERVEGQTTNWLIFVIWNSSFARPTALSLEI